MTIKKSYEDVIRYDKHSNRPLITKSTFYKTVIRQKDTDSVKDRPRYGKPKNPTNEDKNFDDFRSIVQDAHTFF